MISLSNYIEYFNLFNNFDKYYLIQKKHDINGSYASSCQDVVMLQSLHITFNPSSTTTILFSLPDGNKSLGPMVVVFFKMLTGDLLRFSLIYFILLAVFAQGELCFFFFFFFFGGGTLHGYTLVGSYKDSCSLALGELTVSSSYWRWSMGAFVLPSNL